MVKHKQFKNRFRNILITAVGLVGVLSALGYWYVFYLGAPQLDRPQVAEDKNLKFQLEKFNSAAMNQVRLYGVILPPGYAKHPKQHYPVIFLLHGGHDDARAWEEKIRASSVLHTLYQSKQLPPAIIITPDGNDNRGSSPLWDPQYYDGPNGNVSTMIGSELVQVVKSRYRTVATPQAWAIGGLSSGGWGAVNIGLQHLNSFNVLFSHGGYFTSDNGEPAYPGDPAISPDYSVQQLPVQERQQLHVYLDVGQSDSKLLESTQRFHNTLDSLGIANEFHSFPGGHGLSGPDVGWNYFHKHLADSLSSVGKQFKIALEQRAK